MSWVRWLHRLGLTGLTEEEIDDYEERKADAQYLAPTVDEKGEQKIRITQKDEDVLLIGPKVGQAIRMNKDLARRALNIQSGSPDAVRPLTDVIRKIKISYPDIYAEPDDTNAQQIESIREELSGWRRKG